MTAPERWLNIQSGPYPQWRYRYRHRITSPASATGYQHKEVILFKYGMNADFSDIRFTDEMGATCPYYIDSKTDGVTATVWIKVAPALEYHIYLYYGNGSATSESSFATVFPVTNQFAGSGINSDVENNGIERKPFFEKFDVDDLAAYTVTGAPTITSSELVLADGEGIIRSLPGLETSGKWDFTFKYMTDSSTYDSQEIRCYFGVNSYIQIERDPVDGVDINVWYNGIACLYANIVALPDNVYVDISISYDGTNYELLWGGSFMGSGAGDPPVSPSIGISCTDTACTVDEMNYVPSVSDSDDFSSDTEARYMQLSSTNLSTWASSAGDVVVSGGYMTLSSDDDRGIYAVRKAYNHSSGEIEFSFDNNNDGGGGADVCGAVFCYQDILNHYKIVVEDDAAGAELLKIYKVVAGTATQLGSTKDVSATYARGNKTWIKLHYSGEYGQMWAYLRDDAGTYPTSPDISDAFHSSFAFGKVGFMATVTTAGAGNLSVRFDDFTGRTELLVGVSNVPATETGFYFRDEFSLDSISIYDTLLATGVTAVIAGGKLNITGAAAGDTGCLVLKHKFDTVSIETDFTLPATTSYCELYISYDGTYTSGNIPKNGYKIALRHNSAAIYRVVNTAVTGISSTITPTIVNDQTYHLKFTYNSTTGDLSGYFDNEASPSMTANDTTYPNGYVIFRNDTLADGDVGTFDNIVVNGNRIYNKPMPFGAQIGEYWNGAVIVSTTRYITDFGWDVSAEKTDVSATWTIDTNNGCLKSSTTGVVRFNTIQFGSGTYAFKSTGTGSPFFVFGWDGVGSGTAINNGYMCAISSTGNIYIYTYVNGASVGAVSAPFSFSANEIYNGFIIWDAAGGIINFTVYDSNWRYVVGLLKSTTTFSSGYVGYRYSTTSKSYGFAINALESHMFNGASVLNGSTAHGGTWDTGITAGYLLREYADPEPTLELLDRQINPAWPQPFSYEANYSIVNPDATVTCHAITPTMDRTIVNPDATVLCHALAPTTIIYPETGLLTAVSAGRGLNDKMNRATFSYDENDKTNNATTFNRHIFIDLYDHLGVPHRVFFGKAPSGEASISPASNTEVLTAMDYSQNLTMQYLNDAELVLPSLAHQAAAKKYEQHIGLQYLYFQPGMWVHGETSEDSGRIIEVYHGRLILDSMTGGTEYPDPEDGMYYFQDGENLVVGSTVYAIADGHTTDVTGIITLKYPDDHVEMLLGDLGATATNWEFVSGIKPYRLEATSTIWGPGLTVIDADEVFEEMTTKIQAIERWCKILKFIFLVKTPAVGFTEPLAYFISETNIDDPVIGLDLPAPVTITKPDPYLIPPVRRVYDGLEQCNTVKVKCYGYDGTLTKWRWYYATQQTTAVTTDGEPELVFQEIFEQGGSQAECDQRCADLFAYKTLQIQTWYAVFLKRVDFEYLQILTFSGYDADIPDGDYRIIDISYTKDSPTVTRVNCTLVSLAQFNAYLNLSRTFYDSVNNIQEMIRDAESKLPKPELATITRVNTDGTVTLITDRGITKPAVDGS